MAAAPNNVDPKHESRLAMATRTDPGSPLRCAFCESQALELVIDFGPVHWRAAF